jgi:GT2 family glycosyltransferase
MSNPALLALGRHILKPFPNISRKVYEFASHSKRASLGPPSEGLLRQVRSLYWVALDRPPQPKELDECTIKLQSGLPLEAATDEIVRSEEFRDRHKGVERMDLELISGLYKSAFGRQPSLQELSYWLGEAKEGASTSNLLTALAVSDVVQKRLYTPNLSSGEKYDLWVQGTDTIGDEDRAVIRAHVSGLPYRPLVSVVLLTRPTSAKTLSRSLKSISGQLYPNWEFCVALTSDVEPAWQEACREEFAGDPRIKLTHSKDDGTPAETINAALELTTGEYVTFLRAGDILPENSLYEIAVTLGASENIDVLYSDCDQITSAGQRVDPWFKPGWDPDLLLAENYLSDLSVYRRDLLEMIGFLRPGFDGAEFHDLALRATARTAPDRICHIPAVLYHRSKGLDGPSVVSAEVAFSASRRAVQDHLDAAGFADARVELTPSIPNAIRVIWPVPEPEPLVSIVIPTRDQRDHLAQCVEGVLHRTSYKNIEVLIVDNSSTEPATLALFEALTKADPRVRILPHPGPFNHSAMNNAAAREAKGELLLLLNNDVDVINGAWLHELVSQAVRPDVGVVGGKLLYADGRVQHGGIVFSPNGFAHVHRLADRYDPGYHNQLALARTLSAVTGACAMMRREVFFEVGGLDEVNLPSNFNDVDLCLRVGDYGFRIVWTPFAELFHSESASRGHNDSPAKRQKFMQDLQYMRKTWGSLKDPFHNPNILYTWDYLEVPSPPRRQKPWYDFFEQVRNIHDNFPSKSL